MKTKILIVVVALLATVGVWVLKEKTKVDWDKLVALEVYVDSSGGKAFEKMEKVDLAKGVVRVLDLEQARQILQRSKSEVQILTIWKDYQYGVARFSEGKPLRLKVSSHGGFFYVHNFNRKYQVREEDGEEWEALWRNED